jgi:multiple sugar transport system ATP-binding protein
MTLGHRVAVMHRGKLQQCGPPRELYERPVNTFVAGFIGSPAMNLCTLPLGANGGVSFGGTRVSLPAGAANRDSLVLGFRPESLELASGGLPAQVTVVEEVGADAYVFCVADVGGENTRLVARTEARRAPERGERIALRPRGEEAHLFDSVSGERLDSR